MSTARRVKMVTNAIVKCLEMEEEVSRLYRVSCVSSLVDGDDLDSHKENIREFRMRLLQNLSSHLEKT